MADEHDDLLNFENDETDFGDGTINEDELLLSDEENFDDHKEIPKKHISPQVSVQPKPVAPPPQQKVEVETKLTDEEEFQKQSTPKKQKVDEIDEKFYEDDFIEDLKPKPASKDMEEPENPDLKSQIQNETQNVEQPVSEEKMLANVEAKHPQDLQHSPTPVEPPHPIQNEPQPLIDNSQYQPGPHQQPHGQFSPMGPRGFRPQKFGPRGMQRWMNPSGPNAPVPFPPQQRSLRPPPMGPAPPGARMPLSGPPRGPFPPQRGPFFMQRPGGGPSRPPGRFFFQNQPGAAPPVPPVAAPSPAYIPTPINPNLPRKVLINPNFKGGIEAVKSQLLKEHFSSQSTSMSEEELLRKQQEFINSNMRSIEKRRHERSPSPNYRRSYSHSPSPPRNFRRRPFRPYERRKSMGDRDGNKSKEKDENQPEEDEETRAYRQKIETQRKQREELLRQKEMRRKQQMEAKAKETEPLKPIVVTEKKIILTKKPRLEERSTTPPIEEAPLPPTLTTQRRILLKTSSGKEVGDGKVGIAVGEKRKLQKIIKAEN